MPSTKRRSEARGFPWTWLLLAAGALATALAIMLWSGGARAAGGRLDTSFGTRGTVLTAFGASGRSVADAVAIQPDGMIVVAGDSHAGGSDDFALARYTPSGALDTSFGTGGKVLTDFGSGSDDAANAVAIQPDGKIVVAGRSRADGLSSNFAVARYTPSGTLDTSFGVGGTVLTGGKGYDSANAIALQQDGKIVIAGGSSIPGRNYIAVVRLTTNGTLDTSFGDGGTALTRAGGEGAADAVAIQSDGKIVVAGSAGRGGSNSIVLRYTTSGRLDPSFGTGGEVLGDPGDENDARAVAIQPDGKIVVAGHDYDPETPYRGDRYEFTATRYTASGDLDKSFGGGIAVTPIGDYSFARAVALQSDGKIVAAGWGGHHGPVDIALVRYQADGGLDGSFGTHGKVRSHFARTGPDLASAMAIEPDGKIVVVGSSERLGYARSEFALARYLP